MTITEYLASEDYYLDPDLADEGKIKATRRTPCGADIVVFYDNDNTPWRIYSFVNGFTISTAQLSGVNPNPIIAYLRALA